jgi:hypothetical protein
MEQIYKTKWGQYIDLSTIVTLSLENPSNEIILVMYCKDVDCSIDYTFKPIREDCSKEGVVNPPMHLKRVESQVNDLIEAWKKYKKASQIPAYYVSSNSKEDIILTSPNHGIYPDVITGIATEKIEVGQMITFDPMHGHVSLYKDN